MSELLTIEHLSCGYGDRPVLDDVNLSVKEDETVLIAGPNGCGKSTLLKAIIGALPLTGGDIRFQGQSINPLSTEERVRAGIGYLRQTDNIFPGQTVDENLQLAGMSQLKTAYDARALRLSRAETRSACRFALRRTAPGACARDGVHASAAALPLGRADGRFVAKVRTGHHRAHPPLCEGGRETCNRDGRASP